MWPLAVAMELGGCSVRLCIVRPEKEGRNLSLMARRRVDNTGEYSAAWENATMSAGVADWIVMRLLAVLLWIVVVGASMCHRLAVCCERVPVSTGWLLCMTVQSVALKVAVHPSSHNLPSDMRAVLFKAGRMWAWVADADNWGSGRRVVLVE